MENFCQSQPDDVLVLCTAVQLKMSLPELATTASVAEIVDSGLYRELTWKAESFKDLSCWK